MNPKMDDHHEPDQLDDETLAALIDGRLDESRREEVLALLDQHPEALELVAEGMRAADDVVDGLTQSQASKSKASAEVRPFPQWTRILLAAAAVLVGWVGFQYWDGSRTALRNVGPLVTEALEDVSSRRDPRVYYLPLDIPIGLVGATRGTGDVRSPRIDAAVAQLNHVLERDPELMSVRLQLASLLLLAGRTEEAAETAELALDRASDDLQAQMMLALAQFQLGGELQREELRDSALAQMTMLYETSPNAQIVYNYAVMLDQMGRVDDADAMWRAFADYETDGPYAERARDELP